MRGTKTIVLVGGGGHAKAVADAIIQSAQYDLVGILDRGKIVGDIVFQTAERTVTVVGSDEDSLFLKRAENAVICIGDNILRRKVYEKLSVEYPNLGFPVIVHPSAVLALDVAVGQGTVVLAGAVLSSSVSVGEFCILNTRSSIDHDSKLSNYSFIGPGATLCGSVLVGEESFVGAGATVIQGKQIASKSLIGAGSLVTNNILSNTLAYGVPAIYIRSRSDQERYL